jgi:hypothetical protein
MTFKHREFDVSISISPCVEVGWPDWVEMGDDSGLGANRQYEDLRNMSWELVEEAFAAEQAAINEFILTWVDGDEAADDDEDEEDDWGEAELDPLWSLDMGVASVVLALSAAGCVPFTSCNGGAFGGRHYEKYPLVGFYLPAELATILPAIISEAGVGLYQHGGGVFQVYARSIPGMMRFAECLLARREEIDAARAARPAATSEDTDDRA